MADHTFLYTGRVQKMKEIIDTEVIVLLIFRILRIPRPFQPDINVLWTLRPTNIHSYLPVSEEPESINATAFHTVTTSKHRLPHRELSIQLYRALTVPVLSR